MDERDLRGLLGKVKSGRMSRRAFVRRVTAVGLTAPKAPWKFGLTCGLSLPQMVFKGPFQGAGIRVAVLYISLLVQPRLTE